MPLEYLGESEVHRQQAHNALEKYKEENDGFASFRVDRVERVIKAVSFPYSDLVEGAEGHTPSTCLTWPAAFLTVTAFGAWQTARPMYSFSTTFA